VERHQPSQVVILATGAQGQPNSALYRMANNDHKIKISEGDMVVFSQDPIPGSESDVDNLINSLISCGADVYYSSILDDLHVSGHEAAEGLKLMLALTNPKYVYPIGGTLKQLKQYQSLATSMGYKRERTIIPQEGQIAELQNSDLKLGNVVRLRNVLVDGLGIGDVGSIVLRDRQHMAEDGMLMVVVPLDRNTGEIVGDIDIISRGFVYMKESEDLIGESKEVVRKTLGHHRGPITDPRFLRTHLEDELEKFLFAKTHRNPLILPVLVEI